MWAVSDLDAGEGWRAPSSKSWVMLGDIGRRATNTPPSLDEDFQVQAKPELGSWFSEAKKAVVYWDLQFRLFPTGPFGNGVPVLWFWFLNV